MLRIRHKILICLTGLFGLWGCYSQYPGDGVVITIRNKCVVPIFVTVSAPDPGGFNVEEHISPGDEWTSPGTLRPLSDITVNIAGVSGRNGATFIPRNPLIDVNGTACQRVVQ